MTPAMVTASGARWRAATAPVVDRWLESVKPTGVDGRKALDALKAQLQRTGGAY